MNEKKTEESKQGEIETAGSFPLQSGVMAVPFSASKKRGCPTCGGLDPKSCMRCKGKTRLCDWINDGEQPGYRYRPIKP